MMDLLSQLLKTGAPQGAANMASMGMPTVPTDASQLRVPQMPLDPASVPVATGANVAAGVPATMAAGGASPVSGILMALAQGAGMAMGGGGEKQEAPVVAYQGGSGRGYQSPGAEAISGQRKAGRGGILSG